MRIGKRLNIIAERQIVYGGGVLSFIISLYGKIYTILCGIGHAISTSILSTLVTFIPSHFKIYSYSCTNLFLFLTLSPITLSQRITKRSDFFTQNIIFCMTNETPTFSLTVGCFFAVQMSVGCIYHRCVFPTEPRSSTGARNELRANYSLLSSGK